jgi:hypothetical protein
MLVVFLSCHVDLLQAFSRAFSVARNVMPMVVMVWIAIQYTRNLVSNHLQRFDLVWSQLKEAMLTHYGFKLLADYSVS